MPDAGRFGANARAPKVSNLPDREVDDVRYPDLTVDLRGVGDNAHAIIGAVRLALRRHRPRVDDDTIEAFTRQATGGTYDEMIQTCLAWVDLTVGGDD